MNPARCPILPFFHPSIQRVFFPALLALLSACASRPCVPPRHGHEPLGAIWKLKGGDDPVWARPELDDSGLDWRVIDVPGGVADYLPKDTEACWLRARFEAPAGADGRPQTLFLGTVDGAYDLFLNGLPLHGGGAPAAFPLPPGALRPDNVLALRLTRWVNDGGIVDGPVALADRPPAAVPPPPPRAFAAASSRATYDPSRHRLTAWQAGDQPLLDDAHFILRTRRREYDLSRIPEAMVETLPGGRGVRTLHLLDEEKIRFEAWYILPKDLGAPVLAVVGEAGGARDPVDIDLVHHAASPGVVGAGGLRERDGRIAWGRVFVHAPKAVAEPLPEPVRARYNSRGAFELLEESGGIRARP